jgi:tetratricopeptide (TPR) repeat protein
MKLLSRNAGLWMAWFIGLALLVPAVPSQAQPVPIQTAANLISAETVAAAEEIKALLVNADAVFTKGEFPRALSIMAIAVRQARETLGPDHELTINSEMDYASTTYHMGKLDEALPLCKAALDHAVRVLGESHELALDALNNYANALSKAQGVRVALPLVVKAYQLRKVKQGETEVRAIHALNDWAYGLMNIGELHQALPLMEKVLRLRLENEGESSQWTFTAYNNLGVLFEKLGRLGESRRLHETALRLRVKHLGERHPETLVSMNNLARSLGEFGRPDEALEFLNKTVPLMNTVLGPGHFSTLDALQNRAAYQAAEGDWGNARAGYAAVIALRTKLQSLDHPKRLAVLIAQASVLGNLADFDGAHKLLDECASLAAPTFGAENPMLIAVQIERVKLFMRQRKHAEAESLAATNQLLSSKGLGPNHPQTLDLLTLQARAALALGHHDRALVLIEPAIAVVRQLEQSTPLQDLGARLLWLKRFRPTYLTAIQALIKANRVEEAWRLAETLRSRSVRSTLADRRLAQVAGVPDADWLQLQELRERAHSLGTALAKTPTPSERQIWLDSRSQAMKQAEEKQRQLTSLFPVYADPALKGAIAPAQIRQQAASDAARNRSVQIDYLVVANVASFDDKDDRIGAFVRNTNGKVFWVDLGPVADVPGQVVALRAQVSGEVARPVGQRPSNGTNLQITLSAKLLWPLRAHIGNADSLLLAFDSVLTGLPWDVLRWRDRALADSFAVVLSSNDASELKQNQLSGTRRTPSLWAIGSPAFGGASEPLRSKTARSSFKLRQADLPQVLLDDGGQPTFSAGTWQALPAAQEELEGSARMFRQVGAQATVSIADQATESRVRSASRSGELAKASVLLFSTHAFFNPAVPQYSAVVLRRETDKSEADGYLTPDEFVGLKLDAEVTVLSACATAQAASVAGDALAGFAYALRVAGSRNNVLTLWSVADEATAAFTTSLMTRLASGVAPAKALHLTKRAFIHHANRAWRDPRHWAAFVVFGETP